MSNLKVWLKSGKVVMDDLHETVFLCEDCPCDEEVCYLLTECGPPEIDGSKYYCVDVETWFFEPLYDCPEGEEISTVTECWLGQDMIDYNTEGDAWGGWGSCNRHYESPKKFYYVSGPHDTLVGCQGVCS